MMNKDKIIKDLKEKNRKLKNQYELQEARLYSSQHKVDELEEELKTTQEKWQKDKQFYKHRFEDYIEYKNRIDKAIKYINYMFDKANENDIIDDLLKIEKILKGSEK